MINIYISFIPVQSKILWTFIGHCHSSSFFTFYNWTKSFHIFSRSLSICILGSAHFFSTNFHLNRFLKSTILNISLSFLSFSLVSIYYIHTLECLFSVCSVYIQNHISQDPGKVFGTIKVEKCCLQHYLIWKRTNLNRKICEKFSLSTVEYDTNVDLKS